MTPKSLIIIGAGLAGLSAGCYAQLNGYQSHIFEHHSVPGGVAAAWKRKGYLIDGGIHFLMGHRPGQPIYELYCELGTAQANSVLDMTTYLLFEFGMGKPPELMGPLDQIKQFWAMRRMFKYFTGRYAKPVADYVQTIRDPWLRQVVMSLFLPEVPVWFLFMLLALLADGQVGLLKGGCLDFVLPIEKRYKELGGQVTYNATVEEILVEACPELSRRDDCAVDVRLADGSEHRADVVISAADGYSTIFKMLDGRYVDERIEKRYRNWKLIRPVVVVSFGVAREFVGEPPLSIIMLEQPFTVGDQAINWFSLRIFNYGAKFAPPGKTVVQAMFETEWHFWNELRKDRPRYDAEKERVAIELLERLEAHYPGLSSQVEMTDVATPCTWWRYTRNYQGAYMGWLPTPEAIMTSVPRTLPGLANFYMAGQWVMPGGGVPPCLYSGRHVVQLLCHRDRKPFSTTS